MVYRALRGNNHKLQFSSIDLINISFTKDLSINEKKIIYIL